MTLCTVPVPFTEPSNAIVLTSIFTKPTASRLSFTFGGLKVIAVGSNIRMFGVPAWLISRKNWSTKSRASWKSPSRVSSVLSRCCASLTCENTAPTIRLRISITSISSSSVKPCCRATFRFRRSFIVLAPLSYQRANRHRQRKVLHVSPSALHFRRDHHQLGIAGRLGNIPAHVINHLPACGPAIGEVHLITSHRRCRHVHIARTVQRATAHRRVDRVGCPDAVVDR